MKNSFRFLEAFVYPAVLGAALAWFVQALSTRVILDEAVPTRWALLFGFWFIAYHSLWYWFLLTAARDGQGVPIGYSSRSLLTDFIDVVGLLYGFHALGFASGQYEKSDPRCVFLVVFALICFAAAANYCRAKARGKLKSFWISFLLLALVSIAGLRSTAMVNSIGGYEWTLLIVLCFALFVYWKYPELFSAQRTNP